MIVIRSISSIVLALLVLLASSSFYVGVHVCGNTVNAVAFLQEADGCGHQSLPPCHKKMMEGCCENDVVVHDTQEIKADVLTILLPALSATDILHNTVLVAEVVPTIENNPSIYFTDHPPELLGRDVVISTHSFLI